MSKPAEILQDLADLTGSVIEITVGGEDGEVVQTFEPQTDPVTAIERDDA